METLISWTKLIHEKLHQLNSWVYDISAYVKQWTRSEPYMITVAWKSQYDPTNGIDTSHYTMNINPPIELKSNDYSLALLNLEVYYSFPNIKATNNTLKYYSKKLKQWKTISLPTGAYNIGDISVSIGAETLKNGDALNIITLKPLTAESKCEMKLKDGIAVDFNVTNSINTVLGFEKRIYGDPASVVAQVFTSEHNVDIIDINSIYVNCDLIKNSYDNGKISTSIYTFFPVVPPNFKIIERPSPPIYLPLNNSSISSMTVWLTNEAGEVINFRGETITIRFYLQKLPLK